jgi:hypothetical protein
MRTWDCWHRVEYRREVAVGHRTHEYTEIVEDAGWTFRRKEPEQRFVVLHADVRRTFSTG